MRKIKIMCGAIVIATSILFTQAVAQDNNQSIGEDLKKIWGGGQDAGTGTGMDMGGMFDTQAGTDNTDDIGFADDVTASAPIDGGLSVLLAAGVVVGARRIRREVNKSKDKENNQILSNE
jgi:hypothetical protein